MSIRLDLKNNIPRAALLIDENSVAEIIDVNDVDFTVRVYFGVNLNTSVFNPLLYKKIKISISTSEQILNQSLPTKKNVFSQNFNSSNLKKNLVFETKDTVEILNQTNGSLESKIKKSSSISKSFSQVDKISLQSQARYDRYALTNDTVNRKNTDNSTITSKTVYLDRKISNALSNPADCIDLFLPAIANISQEKSYISKSSSTSEINLSKTLISNKKSINEIIDSVSSKNFNEKISLKEKLLSDYLVYSANKMSDKKLLSLNYYEKRKIKKFVDNLFLSTDITIRKSNINKSLFLKFDLFSKNTPDSSGLTVNVGLQLIKLLNVYYSTINKFSCVSSNKKLNSLSNCLTLQVNCQPEDEKKILSYNVYIKNLISEKDKNFKFFNSFLKNESFTTILGNEDYSLCYRVKPVTQQGELNIFSDVIETLYNNKNLLSNEKRIQLLVKQTETNSLELDISFSDTDKIIRKLVVYKRNCTLSQDTEYQIFLVDYLTSNDSFTNKKIVDSNVLLDNVYEYYVESIDQFENIVKTSDSRILKVDFLSKFSYAVEVSGVSVTPETIQFSIQTKTLLPPSEKSLLEEQRSKLRKNAQQNTKVEISSKVQDYAITAYHKVSRIDKTTSLKETFGMITDGLFVDDSETRRISSVSAPIKGRSYMYIIESYKRDPVTLVNDFIVTGKNSQDQNWFFKPSKWMHPRVMNTGVLFEESDEGLSLSLADNFMSDPIGTTIVDNIDNTNFIRALDITNVIVSRATMNFFKISWSIEDNEIEQFDSFIVCKVVNGIKTVVGTTSGSYMYDKLNEENDLGTIFYEVTPVKNDYTLLETRMTNVLTITHTPIDKF